MIRKFCIFQTCHEISTLFIFKDIFSFLSFSCSPVNCTSFVCILHTTFRKCQDPETKEQPPQVCCKKGVLRNFAKFTGTHQRQSLFLIKVVGQAQVFYCKMCDISTNTFFTYTSGRLLQRNRKVLTYKESLTYSFQVIFVVSKLYELYENYTIYIYVGPDRNIGQYLYLRAFSMVIYGNLNSNFLLFFSFFLTVRKLLKSNP